MAKLEPHHVQRLSLIRYQLKTSQSQASMPEPLNAVAISTLHDAVESLLGLCGEVCLADVRNKADFTQIFDAVNLKLPAELSIAGHRAAMLSLNNARVGFKHQGNQLGQSTMDRHLSNAAAFLRDLSHAALGVEFDKVSLLLFVTNTRVRQTLEAAETHWKAGEPREAFMELWTAFDVLVRDYENAKSWHPGRSLFSTKPAFGPLDEELRNNRALKKGFEWMESLDRWVRILALGIDARQYAYFRAHTPIGTRAISGQLSFQWPAYLRTTEEAFGKCMQFVIETALILSRGDFHFDAWADGQPQVEIADE